MHYSPCMRTLVVYVYCPPCIYLHSGGYMYITHMRVHSDMYVCIAHYVCTHWWALYITHHACVHWWVYVYYAPCIYTVVGLCELITLHVHNVGYMYITFCASTYSSCMYTVGVPAHYSRCICTVVGICPLLTQYVYIVRNMGNTHHVCVHWWGYV